MMDDYDNSQRIEEPETREDFKLLLEHLLSEADHGEEIQVLDVLSNFKARLIDKAHDSWWTPYDALASRNIIVTATRKTDAGIEVWVQKKEIKDGKIQARIPWD